MPTEAAIILLGGAPAGRVRVRSLTVNDVLNESPNTATLIVDGVDHAAAPPEGGQDLRISIDSDVPRLLFNGQIQRVDLSYGQLPNQWAWPCSAIDDSARLNNKRPFGTWTNVSATTIAQSITADYAPDFSDAGIEVGLPAVSVNFDGSEGFTACLGQLARLSGGYFKVEDMVVYLFLEDTADAPDPITTGYPFLDDPPITWSSDDSQLRTRGYGRGHAEATIRAVAAGAAVIPVANATAWFNAAGGQVISDTQVLTYTGLGLGYEPDIDGWKVQTGPVTVARSWSGLAWSPTLQLFVAVAAQSTVNDVMTSPDGLTWTARTPAVTSSWRAVVWAEALTLFVAVSSAGLVMTSPDGITWTQRTAAAANAWTGLVWSPALTLLVAVSSNGASQVMTSPDGITWTSRTAAAARTWRGVAWSPSLTLFVACALGGGVNCVMTSPDGITWTQRTTPSTGYNAVAWSAELGRFVVVGGAVGVGVAATSPDGVTWTAQITANGNTWEDLIWVPEMGLFVAVSSDGLSSSENRVMASEDGLAWSAYRTPAVGAWFAVAWGPGRLVAVGITTGAVAQIMAVAPPTYDTLVGIPPSGAGSIVVPLVSGAPVHIWVQRDDLAAQAERIAIDLAQGRVSDGVIEGPIIRDERRGEASLVLRLDADLAQFSRPIVTVTYATRDVKTKSGKTIHIDLASPPIGPIDLTIQSATISQIGIVVGVKPRYDVTASSLRFSVDDVLRQLVAARASVA